MDVVETAILGLIQGLTEFIPVSSSGHLVLAQNLFSGTSNHLFLEFINIGTLLALVVYFWKRIINIIRDVVVNKKITFARNIVITSIPAGLAGYFLSDFIENAAFFGNGLVVAVTLSIVGVVMIILERLPEAAPRASGEQLGPWQALAIGFAQMIALIPGVSRSGSTIIAGRLAGLNAEKAAEYSFLASLPIMLGVTLKIFLKSGDRAYFMDNLPMLVLGNTVAFVSGLIAVGFLLRYLAKHDLAVFGWYRLGLAAIVAVVLLVQ
jgi:undecaprenyl-diphosphatase